MLRPLLTAVLLLPGLPGQAWGRAGHAFVARIAQAHLTPAAEAQVQQLLADDLDAAGVPSGRCTLAEIASWPDELRDLAPAGAYQGWHTRANPVCGPELGPCRDGHCVDELIVYYGRILQDPARPRRERNEALKWVVHLIGDLHQPLHSGVAGDHGQTPVRSLRGKALKPGTTLHAVWDNALAGIALKGWEAGNRPEGLSADDAPVQWMLESRDVALRNVYQPLPGFSCGQPVPTVLDLDAAYARQAVPVIRLQLLRAGFRLADRLNQWLR